MGLNTQLESPTWVAIEKSDTVNPKPSLRGFDVWAAGTVKWTDIENFTQAHTFAAPFPIRILGQVARVWDTGTSLDPSTFEIVGIH